MTTITHRARLVTPELVQAPVAAEREAAYQIALKLVARIDEDLGRDIRHYRNKAGVLLRELDEVVRAILTDDLACPEFIEGPEDTGPVAF